MKIEFDKLKWICNRRTGRLCCDLPLDGKIGKERNAYYDFCVINNCPLAIRNDTKDTEIEYDKEGFGG